ncbi:extracellular solute-binding protein [Paenibacillus sp. HWE-109]|uniref:ABC transporter substrate-binding protein n=1 Tax=Paenibacillus sp. HWE-109 TaxID=1306526 RepID=UPI001EDD0C2F|nr:extracellular solute-binding protein [Paenibacillus sp. HWE-109]UKS23887.1 extracellular solute-binding protein [Paenibacillus sp. HWE-109]
MKKTLTMILAMLMVGSTVACSSGGGTKDNNSGSTSNQNGSNAPAKKVELKVFLGGLDRFRDQFDKYFAQFAEKEKKEKNIVVTINTEYPGSENATQILKTRLATGDVPDIFALHAVNDVPDYYKAGFLEDMTNQPFSGKLIDGIRKLVTIDNKVVAVPLESLAWGYLYNKKMFNDLGLKPPTTLTEMKAVVQKLNDNKITPFMLGYKESWIPQLFLPLAVGGLGNSTQKGFVDRMNKDQGSFAELKDMFGIIDLVNSNGTGRVFEVGNDDGAADFAAGKAAMWVQGPWDADSLLKANSSFDFGVAPLPLNDNPASTLINVSVSTSLAMASSGKNKEVSADLLNFILDDQASNALYQGLKFNPVSKAHTFKPYPWVEDASAYVNKGQSYQDPQIPAAVKDESGKALQAYFSKKMTADDVIKDLDKTWKNANAVANKK